jgi:hypothetical protein
MGLSERILAPVGMSTKTGEGHVSTDWLDEDAGVYTATRVGQSWVAAVDANGGLQDILPINVEPISSISFGPAKPTPPSSGTSPSPPTPTGANVVGGTLTMAATAHDARGNALSGDALYSWATSDPSILALMGDLGTPSDTVTIQFMAAGKATLFAWTPNVQGMTILTVTGESSEDGGAP